MAILALYLRYNEYKPDQCSARQARTKKRLQRGRPCSCGLAIKPPSPSPSPFNCHRRHGWCRQHRIKDLIYPELPRDKPPLLQSEVMSAGTFCPLGATASRPHFTHNPHGFTYHNAPLLFPHSVSQFLGDVKLFSGRSNFSDDNVRKSTLRRLAQYVA